MLPEKTYYLCFYHKDRKIETQEYTDAQTAWKAFRLFAEPDSAELYQSIRLTEYEWRTRIEQELAAIDF